MPQTGTNTLYADIKCPKCGKTVSSGIGFKAGAIAGESYQLGQKLKWEGKQVRQLMRPAGGSLKTVGYYECDNLKCESWSDCFPDIQEALIVIQQDVIKEAKPFVYKPGELNFDILEPEDVT